MIGGNQYGEKITKEMLIRWLQATVFMPALQFSVAPWDAAFDEETIEISRHFVNLHTQYADYILQRFQLAVSDGVPGKIWFAWRPSQNFMFLRISVNPPIWWLDPEDSIAQTIADGKQQKFPLNSLSIILNFLEYLLGDKILVAPILEDSTYSRDVYLPIGNWTDGNTGELHQGPKTINCQAPLNVLPYFIRNF